MKLDFDESGSDENGFDESGFWWEWFLMKVVFDENFFDEIDHFHPNFDESVPNPFRPDLSSTVVDTVTGEMSLSIRSSRSRVLISLTVKDEDEVE